MTVEELKVTAKEMGYKLMPIQPYEKLKACICGCKRREHWYGQGIVILQCERCGRKAIGKSENDARREWNDMIVEMRARQET